MRTYPISLWYFGYRSRLAAWSLMRLCVKVESGVGLPVERAVAVGLRMLVISEPCGRNIDTLTWVGTQRKHLKQNLGMLQATLFSQAGLVNRSCALGQEVTSTFDSPEPLPGKHGQRILGMAYANREPQVCSFQFFGHTQKPTLWSLYFATCPGLWKLRPSLSGRAWWWATPCSSYSAQVLMSHAASVINVSKLTLGHQSRSYNVLSLYIYICINAKYRYYLYT